LRASAG